VCAPFFWGGGAGSASNTMWHGRPTTRPTFVPSGILIHPAVWPQRKWAKNWRGLCPFLGGSYGTVICPVCRPRRHCVRLGPSSPPPQKKGHSPLLFSLCLLWANVRPSKQLLNSCFVLVFHFVLPVTIPVLL